MGKISKSVYFFITLIFFCFIDFYFSNLIVSKMLGGWSFTSSVMNFTYAENTGAAFSIMQNSLKPLIILALLAMVLILGYIFKKISLISIKELFFSALLLAGIFCNLYERMFFGHVRDFFNLTFINFPIFNISDIFINIGVIGIIILILLTKNNTK